MPGDGGGALGQVHDGSPASNAASHSNDESPQHEVVIGKPLAVGKFEVTFGEWDACVMAGGCKHAPGDRNGAAAGGR